MYHLHMNMFKAYDKELKKILNSEDIIPEKLLKKHKFMIKTIQHERLIHLLVTIFVGICMLITSVSVIITEIPSLLLLAVPLIILFIAYIIHYRFLENTTQRWYTLLEEIKLSK